MRASGALARISQYSSANDEVDASRCGDGPIPPTTPHFTAEWAQIQTDLRNEALGARRIGENLIKIRDALKPLGLWLAALRGHGMSQPQASRYIRYAQLPERDRDAFQRVKGFSLTEAIGERRRTAVATVSQADRPMDVEVPADELADRRAEIDRRFKLGLAMVKAGEAALAGESHPPEFAEDAQRWRNKLGEVAGDVLAVVNAGLEAELVRRLLPGVE
jgi:hypothetical protein